MSVSLRKKILLILFLLCQVGLGCGSQGSSNSGGGPIPLPLPSLAPSLFNVTCSPAGINKMNSVGAQHSFFTLAENPGRLHGFAIPNDQSVYVVGDVHGVWEILVSVLVTSNLMEIDSASPTQTVAVLVTKGGKTTSVSVEIPNLRFKSTPLDNKVIFLGDYIAKTSSDREILVLGLLTDILEKHHALALAQPVVVAILGNHDFEAVNGVVHGGYGREKNYQAQIHRLIAADWVVASHVDHGTWFSHSYLTPRDTWELHQKKASFFTSPNNAVGHSGILNQFLKNALLGGGFPVGSWLENSNLTGTDVNFLYAVDGDHVADGNEGTRPGSAAHGYGLGAYTQVPMIVGHMSHTARKALRVLTENGSGSNLNRYPLRSHVLCADTSIYHSRATNTPATFLRMDYSTLGTPVAFHSCSVPMD